MIRWRPLRRDLPFECRRNEDIAIGLPEGLVRYALGALETPDTAAAGNVGGEFSGLEAGRVGDGAAVILHGDDLGTGCTK